ncbi:hypothetical protein [Rubinisphaera margarita]|uniref:hypothetical protein n=1 Tax=Rubinisphaera margarita TaxID=2909586 RepID=UPI001EE9A1C6|nr:hypothetical protein [Rubinisphaera margarita]MCG6156264.1 hypothetical protein [Rubinisphaera margarita]
MNAWSALAVWSLTLVLFSIPAAGFAEDDDKQPEQKTFEGTWRNQKYNSSGPLKCVARPGENGRVNATFSGLFMGDPFSYDVEFQAKPGRSQVDLAGEATVSGHIYQWKGALKGPQLLGRYTGTNGYVGDFALQETEPAEESR